MMIRMRNVVALVFVLLALFTTASAATLEVTTDRPDAIYKSGEAVRFLVTLKEGERPITEREIEYTVTGDAGVALSSGTVTSGEKPAPVVVATSKPEFFRCEVWFKTDATTKP